MLADFNLLILVGVAGFLLFLLSVRKPWGRTARRTTGKMALTAFICAMFFLAVVAFVAILSGAWPEFGGDEEAVNLTYDQYVSAVGMAGFDPRGADDISFRSHSTIRQL